MLFLILCTLAPSLFAAAPWDAAFAKDTRAALEAAQRASSAEDRPVVVLLEEHRYAIDREGRTTSTLRKVYRILKEEAVEDWASVEHGYQPWYEQIPQIRARVITTHGATHWLDPKTIADSPPEEFDSNIFSDRRVLRAPLPAVGVGSVVEYEISIREKAPVLDSGVTRRIIIMDAVKLERFHLLIEADKAIELRTLARLIPEAAIRRKATSTGTQIECELGPLDVQKDFEFGLPADTPGYPYISFSTGKSWQAIAARYKNIVDQQIKASDLKAILEGINLKGSPLSVSARLTAQLHKEVRYTGVEFGEAAIVPRPPGETLQRKYGDCKDKSALLVAMLRAAGLNAYVALLASGFSTEVDENLPGFGLFDHAIVYVASQPPLWIDATAAETRVGLLPPADQGRLALIASRDTTALVKTPEAEAKDNWQRHTIEVRLSDYGPGAFAETMEMGGAFEANMRVAYGNDDKKAKELLESYVKQNFLAKSLGKYEVTSKNDLSGPFRMMVQALQATRASTGLEDAAVALFPFRVFDELPFALKPGLDGGVEDVDAAKKSRKHDFVFSEPYEAEYRYKIYVPPLFKVSNLPASTEVKLGPATYTRKYQLNEDGTAEAVFRLNTGKRRLTPAEFESFREALRQHSKQVPELITFVPETSELMALGQMGKALSLVRASVDRNMERASSHVRLSRMLINAGLGDASLAEGKKAAELDSKSSQVWQALGWAYQHDTFGRRFQGNWNFAEAEACYRKAIEADPGDLIARADLAILLEHNAQGYRYAKGARLEEAITLYEETLKKQTTPALQQNLAIALIYAGQLDKAKAELQKAGSGAQVNLQPVITALQQGAAKAIVEAQTAMPDPKQRALYLASVSFMLTQMRRYDLASTFMGAAARLASSAEFQTQVELLRKIKRYEEVLLPASDPRSPVQRLFLQILLGESKAESFQPLFTSREGWTTWSKEIGKLRGQVAGIQHQFAAISLADDAVVDLVLSLLDLRQDGEEGRGFRITGTSPGSGRMPVMHVIREDGEYRILGATGNLEHVGQLVLELLDRKDIKGAQWWLDKVLMDVEAPRRRDGDCSNSLSLVRRHARDAWSSGDQNSCCELDRTLLGFGNSAPNS